MEEVLCFERSLFEKIGVFQGINLDVQKYFPVVTNRAAYLNRGSAEQDKRYKQLIPYAIIVCGDKILRYRRGPVGLETRLRGSFSVGIGGHIPKQENAFFSSPGGYREAMQRELMEEVSINITRETAVAVINDDSTDVGYVHFGIVHVVQVADENITSYRNDIVGHEFVPMTDVIRNPYIYEPWSRFCLENLYALLSRAAADSSGRAPIIRTPHLDVATIHEILDRRVAFGF